MTALGTGMLTLPIRGIDLRLVGLGKDLIILIPTDRLDILRLLLLRIKALLDTVRTDHHPIDRVKDQGCGRGMLTATPALHLDFIAEIHEKAVCKEIFKHICGRMMMTKAIIYKPKQANKGQEYRKR